MASCSLFFSNITRKYTYFLHFYKKMQHVQKLGK
ncbi:hypothetical protein NC651_025711 [Populus alba x Populus x berolinensis]|nr:hypothetical protein NC651_025711 [Populus alba x Populus x berolinensis]